MQHKLGAFPSNHTWLSCGVFVACPGAFAVHFCGVLSSSSCLICCATKSVYSSVNSPSYAIVPVADSLCSVRPLVAEVEHKVIPLLCNTCLLSKPRTTTHNTRCRTRYSLPRVKTNRTKKCFINWCLFNQKNSE